MIQPRKESSTHYAFVIKVFSDSYRLIECRDNYQWIVQRLTGNRWRSEWFFKTKAALHKQLSKLGLKVDALSPLPDNFRSQFKLGQGVILPLSGRVPLGKKKADSDHALSASVELSDA